MERKNIWTTYSEQQLQELDSINEKYKACLDAGKTERECVEITIRKVAPLGDPLETTVRGYELSIRKADAELIEVR